MRELSLLVLLSCCGPDPERQLTLSDLEDCCLCLEQHECITDEYLVCYNKLKANEGKMPIETICFTQYCNSKCWFIEVEAWGF